MKKLNIVILVDLIYLIPNIICPDSSEDFKICPDGKIKYNPDGGECKELSDNIGTYFCECYSGYYTYPEDNDIQCNYKKKSQLKAFLLELFLCYGAGHFYVHNYRYAIPKLIVFAFFYCLFIALRIITKAKEENKLANLIICISAGVTLIGMLAWQIVDLINFGYNKYKDGNKVSLLNW